MILTIYTIVDNVSRQHTPLFLSPNEVTARREFARFLQADVSSADFDLWRVGSFDPETITIPSDSTGNAKEHIVNGAVLRPSTAGGDK